MLFAVGPLLRSVVGRDDDSSPRLKWVNRHVAQAGSPEYRFDVHDPVRGWALAPNIRGMVVFNGKILNSNYRGIVRCSPKIGPVNKV